MEDGKSSLYPNDGSQLGGDFYPKNEEAQNDESEERAKVTKEIREIDALILWFDQQIKLADSIDNIDDTSLTINGTKYETKYSVEAQMLAQKKLKRLLLQRKHDYMVWKDKYDSKK